jgi:hypothetical protein
VEKGNEATGGGTSSGASTPATTGKPSGGAQADQTKERGTWERKVTFPDGSSARLNRDGRFEYSDANGNPMKEPDAIEDDAYRGDQAEIMAEWLDDNGAKLDEWADFGERQAQLDPQRAALARKLAENSRVGANQTREAATSAPPPAAPPAP